MARGLTIRQEKFVEAITDPSTSSQTEAGRKAGYSPRSVKEIASENMAKPNVANAIAIRKTERSANSRSILQKTNELLNTLIHCVPNDTSWENQIAGIALVQKAVVATLNSMPESALAPRDDPRSGAWKLVKAFLHGLSSAFPPNEPIPQHAIDRMARITSWLAAHRPAVTRDLEA